MTQSSLNVRGLEHFTKFLHAKQHKPDYSV